MANLHEPLPPTNAMRRFARVSGRLTLWGGLLPLAAGGVWLVLHFSFVPFVLIVVGVSNLLIFGISAWVCNRYARRSEEEIAALLAGNYLLHWVYSASEWNEFARKQWAQESFARNALMFAIIGLVAGGLLGFLAIKLAGPWATPLGALAGAVLFLLIAWLVAWATLRRYPLSRRPVQLYLTGGSLYYHRFHATWRQFGTSLAGVEVADGILEVRINIHAKRTTTHTYRFPIPPGDEQEAAEAVEAVRRSG